MNSDMIPSPDSGTPGRLRRRHRHLGTGVFLILLGLLLALDQWHQAPFHDIGRHWPLILIALSVGKFVDRGLLSTGAHWMLLVGLFFELQANGQHHWIYRFWPLGLVWIGLIMTLRALRPRPEPFCG